MLKGISKAGAGDDSDGAKRPPSLLRSRVFLLAGTGAYLSLAQGKSVKQVFRVFWTRGLWLMFLELTVIQFAWNFPLASPPPGWSGLWGCPW
jgi:hypothetical protein